MESASDLEKTALQQSAMRFLFYRVVRIVPGRSGQEKSAVGLLLCFEYHRTV